MSARHLASVLLMLVAALTMDARVTAQEPPGAAVEAEVETAPVEVDGAVLFRVRGVSSFSAEHRARLIRDRVIAAAADPAISPDSLRVVDGAGVTRIMTGDQTLMGIVESDASLEQVDRNVLAAIHLARIQRAIVDYRAARSSAALRRGAITALVATLVMAIAVVALVWFWRWFDRLLTRLLRARIQTVGIQSFELMRSERIWAALRSMLAAIKTFVFLAIALVYLNFLLGQFPATRGLSQNVSAFVLGPLEVIARGFLASVPSLVFLAILFYVFRLALRLIRVFFDAVERRTVTLKSFDAEWALPTYKIVRILVVAFGLVVAYPYIPGSGSDAFKGVSLFIGVVFSLGSSTAISNIIAGYMMTYRRAFKVGDRVKIGDAVGDVINMRLQVTHLRSLKNEELIIPNSQVLNGEVLNYSSLAEERGLILHTEVGIGYETPWRQVEAMLLLAAERTPGLLTEPRPFVMQKKLADFAVTYELNAYCRDVPRMMRYYTELHRNILDVFNEYGVQIMTPAYEGDPDEPKVVAHKDWYSRPAAPPSHEQPTVASGVSSATDGGSDAPSDAKMADR